MESRRTRRGNRKRDIIFNYFIKIYDKNIEEEAFPRLIIFNKRADLRRITSLNLWEELPAVKIINNNEIIDERGSFTPTTEEDTD